MLSIALIKRGIKFIVIVSIGIASNSLLASTSGDIYENSVTLIAQKISEGELEEALTLSNQLIKKHPNSRIAYMLKGDVLTAMNGDLFEFGEGLKNQSLDRNNFRHELKNRWLSNEVYQEGFLPASVLEMGNDSLVLLGEMETGRFFLFENNGGKPKRVDDFYMTIGKKGYGKQVEGDNKTPLGVYRVTHEIRGSQLPDLYGSGAFPVDYPNVVDKWRQRTGYGIWLHGTPSETYSRAPYATEGCFVLSNEDYETVAPIIRAAAKPPVVLTKKIEWLTPEQHEERRQNLLATVNDWAQDWESLDVNRYLQNYDRREFQFGKKSFSAWSKRKRSIGAGKTFIQLGLDIKGLYQYPGEENMFVVDFRQSYLSNNHKSQTNKKQYWRKNRAGEWKIVFEG